MDKEIEALLIKEPRLNTCLLFFALHYDTNKELSKKCLVHCLVPGRHAPSTDSTLTRLLQNVRSTPVRRITKMPETDTIPPLGFTA